MVDFGAKVAIASLFGGLVMDFYGPFTATQFAKYGRLLAEAPGSGFRDMNKLISTYFTNPDLNLREKLLDGNIPLKEKLRLIKLHLKSTLKNLKGPKRREFIIAVLALIYFLIDGNWGSFAFGLGKVQQFISQQDDIDDITSYLIELYKEYNAPYPKELIEIMPSELLDAMKNLK